MRKGMWSATVAFVLLLSGAGVVLGVPRVGAADGQVAMVEGSQNDPNTWRFTPEEITVSVGSTVVWHNNGQQQHTATAEDNSFASAYLNGGQEFKFKFAAPGDFKYFCEPHKALGMVGVVHVTGAGTPTTAATTVTTTATTATTAPGSPTTTTTRAGASTSSTATTTPAAGGATTTTLAPAVTPTSAPDSASSTTTTTAAAGQSAEEGAEGASKHSKGDKSSPIGIAFAAVSTLLLGAVSAKLLASKP